MERILERDNLLTTLLVIRSTALPTTLVLVAAIGIPVLATPLRQIPITGVALAILGIYFSPRRTARIILLAASLGYLIQAFTGLLAAPVLVLAAALLFPSVREVIFRKPRAVPSWALWCSGVVIGILSAAIVWATWLAPYLNSFALQPALFPSEVKNNLLYLIPAVLLASATNSIFEESLWRGAISTVLKDSGISPVGAVLVAALAFGAAHYYGVPPGLLGIVLTTFFAVGASALLLWSRSLLPGMMAHFIADVSILMPLAIR